MTRRANPLRFVKPPRGGKSKQPRISREGPIHRAMADFLQRCFPRNTGCGVVWFHNANGEWRDEQTAARLKAMGVLSGVWDIVLFWDDQVGWIEAKYEDGDLSENQLLFMRELRPLPNHHFAVCNSVEELEGTLRAWLGPERVRLTTFAPREPRDLSFLTGAAS